MDQFTDTRFCVKLRVKLADMSYVCMQMFAKPCTRNPQIKINPWPQLKSSSIPWENCRPGNTGQC